VVLKFHRLGPGSPQLIIFLQVVKDGCDVCHSPAMS
jgi:hypothetical protein